VGVCVCIRTHTHTLHRWGTWFEPRSRDETPGGPEESRWTKSLHVYIHICVQSTRVYVYARRPCEILDRDQLVSPFPHFFFRKRKAKDVNANHPSRRESFSLRRKLTSASTQKRWNTPIFRILLFGKETVKIFFYKCSNSGRNESTSQT